MKENYTEQLKPVCTTKQWLLELEFRSGSGLIMQSADSVWSQLTEE